VALAAESYRRDQVEKLLNPAEILQMFGRAGRRGLDETGFVLITPNEVRLLDARPCHLSRSGAVDWAALLNLMAVAAQHARDPFKEAVQVQERLFTMKPIFLGVEESLRHPDVPCGLRTDAERARHVRKRVREMVNSRGEWEFDAGAGAEGVERDCCAGGSLAWQGERPPLPGPLLQGRRGRSRKNQTDADFRSSSKCCERAGKDWQWRALRIVGKRWDENIWTGQHGGGSDCE